MNQAKTEMLLAFAEHLITNAYTGRTHFLGHFISNELAHQFPEQFEKVSNRVFLRNGLRLDCNLSKAFNLDHKQEETLYKIFNFTKFYKTDNIESVSKEMIAHAIFDFCTTVQSCESTNRSLLYTARNEN
jgi:hypothetical protein